MDARGGIIVFGDEDRSHSISVDRAIGSSGEVSCEDPEATKNG